jgi:hypothetical protein
MKIDQFIRKLMPKDDKFYWLMEESANPIKVVVLKITSTMNMEELEPIVEEIVHRAHIHHPSIFHELNVL